MEDNNKKTVGRPQGVYKHISPLTGMPVHSWQYRKDYREAKRKGLLPMPQEQPDKELRATIIKCLLYLLKEAEASK